ncbi:MAG: class I SAM-dependent methyltransferase [Thermoproteota archaeon]
MGSNTGSARLSKFYSLFPWPEDPYSEHGRKRYEDALKDMEILVSSRTLQNLVEKKTVKVLEACGGTGIGGVALSKVLMSRGVSVDLLVTDLRGEALETAERFGYEETGCKVRTALMDAREINRIGEKFNLVLLYGLSTPHFNPWDFVRLLSSAGEALNDDGFLAVEEVDRRYSIFLTAGYKWALYEAFDETKPVISFHAGYDLKSGMVKRVFWNFKGEPLSMELYYWGFAELACLTWVFFKDVDLVGLGRARGFIVGVSPRRLLKPEELEEPSFKPE